MIKKSSFWERETAVLVLTFLFFLTANLSANAASWDVAGKWLIDGVGFAEKSFVRVRLALDGYADIFKETSYDVALSRDMEYVTSYDLYLNLTVTGLEINAWSGESREVVRDRVPLSSDLNPTLNEPFEFPPVPLKDSLDGLRCQFILESAQSGKVKLYGTLDSLLGGLEINTEGVFWKEETAKPGIDTSKSSGCGVWPAASFLIVLPFMFRRFRVK